MRMIQDKEFLLKQLKVDQVYSKDVAVFGVSSKQFISAEDEYAHVQMLIKDGHVKSGKAMTDTILSF